MPDTPPNATPGAVPGPKVGVAPGAEGGVPDVLVVGGGTAGCALAARLVAAGRSVRLLEAGERERAAESLREYLSFAEAQLLDHVE